MLSPNLIPVTLLQAHSKQPYQKERYMCLLPCLMMRWSNILPVVWAGVHTGSPEEVYKKGGPLKYEQCFGHLEQPTVGILLSLPRSYHSSTAASLFPKQRIKAIFVQINKNAQLFPMKYTNKHIMWLFMIGICSYRYKNRNAINTLCSH